MDKGVRRVGQRRGLRRLALLPGLCMILGMAAAGEQAARTVSRGQYRAELVRMSAVVKACRGQAGACDEKAVPADETVEAESGQVAFGVRWDWLREVLKKAAVAADKDRGIALDGAAGRLQQDFDELAGGTANDANARRKVDEVLARPEFGTVQEVHWWDRMLGKVFGRAERWLNGVGKVIPWGPWMGLTLEWGLLAAAVAGLIAWGFRLVSLERVSFASAQEPQAAWQAESDDWAAKAKEVAGRGAWREAVHCLYWSAIVMLEGQKLWRQNRARTPREYVALLEPGSARRRALSGLTGVFERIWYGIRPATAEDYQKATVLLDELRVG